METPSKIEARIALAEERFIQPLLYPETRLLKVEMWEVGVEPVSYDEAMSASFTSVGEGAGWGRAWDTAWFHCRGEVPGEWAGREVVALMNLSFEDEEGFGREGLVWMDGKPSIAVSRNRTAIPLLEMASGGEQIEFHVEAAANPAAVWHWGQAEHAGHDASERLFQVKTARLAVRDDNVFQFLIDFRICSEAMLELPEAGMRRARLRRGLDAACRIMEAGSSAWIAPVRNILAPLLACRNGSTTHRITAVGHAHIDTAWCWPLRETIRKCARTFSTTLAYMEKHPDYHFSCSQPVQYLWMKHHYPDIYAGIREAVKRGQWEPVGSMWIEADCNIPSGESLVRQLLHGKRFFEREFGVETRDLWLPDVFGYSAALPQILKKSGIDWFMSQKISWNDTNRFPHHSFLWEGLDGTRVFTHFPPVDTYNGRLNANELARADREFAQKDRASRSLLPFGQGDGGGGPTVEMIERARRWRDFEGMPQVEMGTVRGFFEVAEREIADPPVWCGELYLELHRGTYTSQARNKRSNRRCETLLRDAEFFEAIASVLASGDLLAHDPAPDRTVWDIPGHAPDKDNDIAAMSMDRAWKLLLLNQFHDIIPGSSIGWVYEDSQRDYEVIETIATAVREAALNQLTEQIPTAGVDDALVVFNSLAQKRREVVQLPDGTPFMVEVPPCGYTVASAAAESSVSPVTTRSDGERIHVSNGLIEFSVEPGGCIESVRDLKSGNNVLAGPGNEFHLLRDYPNKWSAWDVEASAMDDFEVVNGTSDLTLVESGPLRSVIEFHTTFGSSSLAQRIILRAGSKRIDFETTVDWHERHRLLKVAFPTSIRTDRAQCEVQFGHLGRPVHRNTSWDAAQFEVCAQRWVDLSDGHHGVALLNDGIYGHDFRSNEMRLSLLKGPHAPDPDADLGEHRFTYSLFPHEGTMATGGVIEEALALNTPLLVRKAIKDRTAQGDQTHSWLSIGQSGVILEAFKKAEDGNGLVLRFSEAHGSRQTVSVAHNLPVTPTGEVDLLERTVEAPITNGPLELELRAFDLRTLRFT